MSSIGTTSRVRRLSRGVVPHYRKGRLVTMFGGASLVRRGRGRSLLALLGSSSGRCARSVFVSTGRQKGARRLRGVLVGTTRLPAMARGSVVMAGMERCRTLDGTLRTVREMRSKLSSRVSKSFLSRSVQRYVFFVSSVTNRIAGSVMLRGVFRRFYING